MKDMKRWNVKAILVLFLCMLSGPPSFSQNFIPLWPHEHVPNSKGLVLKDSILNERIMVVGTPGMTAFFPASVENKHCAVLICPGGAYERLAYIASGFQLAKWFNSIGVAAFVLNYRLPNSPDLKEKEKGPLQDAQRAMKLIRANAVRWNIDADKIGVQGTSAGGHLAAMLSTFKEDMSAIRDSLDKVSFTPDFTLLLSPVITMGEYTHPGSRKNLLGEHPSDVMIKNYSLELQVSKSNPPTFLVHAFNDKAVPLQNTLLFYEALAAKKVSSSLHVFPQGGHAILVHNNPGSTEYWTDLCAAWLREMGFTESKK
jgi:acetyl esterase/lipase